jgi:hypothetical protein
MDYLPIITWANTAVSALGAVLNARMNIKGFYFWIVANTVWMAFDAYVAMTVTPAAWAQVAVYGFFNYTSIQGLISWKKKQKQKAIEDEVFV